MSLLQHTLLVILKPLRHFSAKCVSWIINENKMKHLAWHRLLQYAPTAIFQGRMFSQAMQWRGQDISVDVRVPESIWALPFICHLLQMTSYLRALFSCHICFLYLLSFQSFLNHFFCVCAACNLVEFQLWFRPESAVAALIEGWCCATLSHADSAP